MTALYIAIGVFVLAVHCSRTLQTALGVLILAMGATLLLSL